MIVYRLQPDHSLATKQLEGKKQDKERLTIVIYCNEDGSEKIHLWFIGKCAKPQCFKNVNLSNMNCEYHVNKQAWMTRILFQEYVRQLDRKMDDRKVILLVDNYPAHLKTIEGLKNIELFFFCYPIQHQRFNLVMWGSYELSRCIIIVDFIEIFWRVMKLGSQIQRR